MGGEKGPGTATDHHSQAQSGVGDALSAPFRVAQLHKRSAGVNRLESRRPWLDLFAAKGSSLDAAGGSR